MNPARRNQLLAIAGFALIIVVALIVISQSGGDDDGGGGSGAGGLSLAGIEQRGNALGDPDAPLTMVEFADLQCPFCAEFATGGALAGIVDEYVRAGDLRIEFEPLTFIGPDSVRAARVAVAAGEQGRLWDFVDLFYENQGPENSGYADDEFITRLLERIEGLDVDRVLADREEGSVTRALEQAARRAEDAGIDSTPSFLLGPTGGELEPLAVDSLDFGAFEGPIEDALAAANG